MTADEKSASENELCRCSSIDYCSAERIFCGLEWRCHLSVFVMQLCKIGLRPVRMLRFKMAFIVRTGKKLFSWQISNCMLL